MTTIDDKSKTAKPFSKTLLIAGVLFISLASLMFVDDAGKGFAYLSGTCVGLVLGITGIKEAINGRFDHWFFTHKQ